MRDDEYEALVAAGVERTRDRLVREYGTDEEREAHSNADADRRAAIVAACEARRDAEDAERERRAELRREREYLVERAMRLRRGGFPERLVDVAVGVVVTSTGAPVEMESDGYRRLGDDPIRDLHEAQLRDTAALTHARGYLNDRTKTALALLGGVGAGKSVAATRVAWESQTRNPDFISATVLEKRGRYDKETSERLEKSSLLVLDDLGVEPLDSKGYFVSLIDELVDAFYGSKRRLVVTSNLSAKTIAERYGARIWSRLCEVGTIASCGNVDLRRAP